MTSAEQRRTELEQLIGSAGFTRANPPILLPAGPYFDLAGEEFRARLLLTTGSDGAEYCLRPDFTLPLAQAYLQDGSAPAAYAYFGPVFRQRATGPTEFEQAGLELLGQPDPDAALDEVLRFALQALAVYGVDKPRIRLGSVAMFEALLAGADMPEVWRPRLRHRFGHPESLDPLLKRLADPHGALGNIRMRRRAELIPEITEQMLNAGMSLTASRSPEEVADRFIEKQALANAYVPGETIRLLKEYLHIAGPAPEALEKAAELMAEEPADFKAARQSLATHAQALAARAPGAELAFDAGFAPRLDYYTGIVFEITGKTGEVLVSGGQYDRLLQRLGAGHEIPASGCALWVGRLQREAAQ